MKNLLYYKDYVGSIEYSEEDNIFFGRVQGIQATILYDGASAQELVSDFHRAVDDYLLFCEQEGKTPEKPYKGKLNIRLTPESHRRLALYSMEHHVSINHLIEAAVEAYAPLG